MPDLVDEFPIAAHAKHAATAHHARQQQDDQGERRRLQEHQEKDTEREREPPGRGESESLEQHGHDAPDDGEAGDERAGDADTDQDILGEHHERSKTMQRQANEIHLAAAGIAWTTIERAGVYAELGTEHGGGHMGPQLLHRRQSANRWHLGGHEVAEADLATAEQRKKRL
ncbi:hypothetical protein KCV01_g19381, partial [Aureobasidium melanogenum]